MSGGGDGGAGLGGGEAGGGGGGCGGAPGWSAAEGLTSKPSAARYSEKALVKDAALGCTCP